MTDDSDKLAHARWVLERHLHWIAAAEVKVGVVIAIDTGLIGALAAALNGNRATGHVYLGQVCSLLAAILLGAAIVCAAMTLLPRVEGPPSSMIFFGKIAAKPQAEFVRQFSGANSADFLADCLAQIHRNAEIACEKYKWVRMAMWCSFFGAPFWAAAIATLVRA
jgi:uncharacterized membrane protein YeaQ/YmgE (transglycosylase-associated protein family)